MSFSFVLHFLRVLSLKTNFWSILKFCSVFWGHVEYKIVLCYVSFSGIHTVKLNQFQFSKFVVRRRPRICFDVVYLLLCFIQPKHIWVILSSEYLP